MPKPFLITGCGRSGTTFVYRLLNTLGLRVSHEEYFRSTIPFCLMERHAAAFADWCHATGVDGEVSGLAPPFLPVPETTIIHQLRNPVAVIASLMGLGNLTPDCFGSPNIKLNFRYLAEMHPDDDPLTLSMKYWLGWNRLVEPHAALRYRVESLPLGDVFAVIDRPAPEMKAITLARAQYGRHWHTGRRDQGIFWATLPAGELKEQIHEKALEYGYTDDELRVYCPHCGR